jgi:uroporphyrinogen decarboxylase
VEPCEPIKRLFESDFRRVGLNVLPPKIVDNKYANAFGVGFRKAEPHEYYDVISHPLIEAEIEDLERMQMPDPDHPDFYRGLKGKAKDLYENSPYAVVADVGVPGFYETSQRLRGYEQLACDLLINRDFITALYDRLLELQKQYFRNYLREVGQYVQVVGYAEDLGMQDRPQMSPQTYREVIKPYHQAIFSFIHEHTDAKIFLHCCGSIYPLIDDLIDAGVDILNPVQTRAKDMEPGKLKEAFGDRLIFWGAFDEQELLPQGTPAEIDREVEKLMRVLGADGGYVFAASHNVQEDTPPHNVVAMYQAARKYRDYQA